MEMIPFEKYILGTTLRFYIQRKFEGPLVLKDVPENLPKCLEIGCGHGAGLFIIKQMTKCRELIGIDMDPQLLAKSSEKLDHPPYWVKPADTSGISVLKADASDMPFPDNHFDAAFLFDALHHITEWKKAVEEIFRVLKPSGIFAFEEAAITKSPFWLNSFLRHVPFNMEEMLEHLKKSGFIIKTQRKIPLLPYCFVKAEKPL
ncbi:MAG: class I SAM-dependent methyltransferase [Firmicutes bacterium]|nr:class I SAM-dependent methyltransferase [Bacillota bacterium]